MVYLNKGFFKPMCIILSLTLLPLDIGCWGLTFYDFTIGRLLVSLIMLISYIAILIGIYLYSKKAKAEHLFFENDFLVVNYPNMKCAKIKACDIVKIEYYKILSIKAWCMLFNTVGPQCAYITYLYNGKEICNFIGYPDYNELKKLCADINVKLVVK